jgi:hypothetical protein
VEIYTGSIFHWSMTITNKAEIRYPRKKPLIWYSVTHVRNSKIKQLRPLFFAMLWDIDLIFGMWVYNDKLQINFTFRSGPIIFGQVMALGLWNLAKYLVVTTFFRYAWRYWLDFWLWVYNDELQIKFTFRFGPMIFGRVMTLGLWNLAKYLVVTTLFHYDLRYWLDFWYESV